MNDTIEGEIIPPGASTKEPQTALAIIKQAMPVLLQNDTDDVFGKLGIEYQQFLEAKHDPSTRDGREAIVSMAYRVSTSKMDVVRLAKKLKEGAQKTIKSINAEVSVAEERFDALRDAIRAEVTEYEQREKRRIDAHEAAIIEIETWSAVDPTWTAEQIQDRITEIAGHPHLTRDWQEFKIRADRAASNSYNALKVAQMAAAKRETDARAEIERQAQEQQRLAEEAAKLQAEREAQIARDAANNAAQDAELRTERRMRIDAVRAIKYRPSDNSATIKEKIASLIPYRDAAWGDLNDEAHQAIDEAHEDLGAVLYASEADEARQAQQRRKEQAERERLLQEAAEHAREAAAAATAREEADGRRVARIRRMLANITAPDDYAHGRTSADVQGRLTLLSAMDTEPFEEFDLEARDLIATEIARMTLLHTGLVDAEARERAALEQRQRDEAAQLAQQELQAKSDAERIERERRENNLAHRRVTNREAVNDLMNGSAGLGADTAKAVIEQIARGEVKHVKIQY